MSRFHCALLLVALLVSITLPMPANQGSPITNDNSTTTFLATRTSLHARAETTKPFGTDCMPELGDKAGDITMCRCFSYGGFSDRGYIIEAINEACNEFNGTQYGMNLTYSAGQCI